MVNATKFAQFGRAIKLMILGQCLFLASCGGGTSYSITPTPTTPAPTQAISAEMSMATDLPADVVKSITEIVTPSGSGIPNSVNKMLLSSSGYQGLVIASNKDGSPVLLSTGPDASGKVQLSIESTAIALVRMLIGNITGITPSDIDSAIRTTSDFQKFKTALSDATAKGEELLSSDLVIQLAKSVRSQTSVLLQQKIASNTIQKTTAFTTKTAIKVTEVTTESLQLLGGSANGNLPAVIIKGYSKESESLNLTTSIPIEIDAIADKITTTLKSDNVSLTILLNYAIGKIGQPYDMVIAPKNVVTLHLKQSNENKKKNVVSIISGLLSAGLNGFVDNKCSATISNIIVDQLINIFQTDATLLSSLILEELAKIKPNDLINACAVQNPSWGSVPVEYASKLLKVSSKIISVGWDIKDTGLITYYLAKYWDLDENFSICLGKDVSLLDLLTGSQSIKVVNCAVSIETKPTKLLFIPGATLTNLQLVGKDVSGKTTGLPLFTSVIVPTSFASDLQVDQANGSIKAIGGAKSGLYLEVKSPGTSIDGKQIPVEIVNPVIEDNAPFKNIPFVAGGPVTLSLRAPDGSQVITAGAGIKWDALFTSEYDVFSVVTGGDGGVMIKLNRTGENIIFAYSLTHGKYAEKTLVIGNQFLRSYSISGTYATTKYDPTSSSFCSFREYKFWPGIEANGTCNNFSSGTFSGKALSMTDDLVRPALWSDETNNLFVQEFSVSTDRYGSYSIKTNVKNLEEFPDDARASFKSLGRLNYTLVKDIGANLYSGYIIQSHQLYGNNYPYDVPSWTLEKFGIKNLVASCKNIVWEAGFLAGQPELTSTGTGDWRMDWDCSWEDNIFSPDYSNPSVDNSRKPRRGFKKQCSIEKSAIPIGGFTDFYGNIGDAGHAFDGKCFVTVKKDK